MKSKGSLNQLGATLIDTVVGIAVGTTVLSGVTAAVVTQTQTYRAQNQVVDMQTQAVTVMGMISRDLRMAGYNPVQGYSSVLGNYDGVTYNPANPAQLIIQADLNGNGVTTDLGETIVYAYDPTGQQVFRSISGSGIAAQNVFPNIQSFTLSYLDSSSNPTTVSANICQVGVALTARTALPDSTYPSNNGYRTVTLQIQVTPRNLCLL